MSRTIEVKDYEAFSNGVSTVNALQKSIESENTKITSSAEKLGSDTIFAGPISDSCQQGFEVLAKRLNLIMENMTTIADYLTKAKSNYENADSDAKDLYLSINKDGKLMMTESEKTAADNIANSIIANPDSAANQALINSMMSEVGNKRTDYDGNKYSKFNQGAWCADYVSLKLKENGYDYDWATVAGTENDNKSIIKAMKNGGADIHYGELAGKRGKKYDADYTPKPGDVFVIDTDGDPNTIDHTGFVVSVNGDGTFTSIEGNTYKEGVQGYKEGFVNDTYETKYPGVVEVHKDRKMSDVYAWATPKK